MSKSSDRALDLEAQEQDEQLGMRADMDAAELLSIVESGYCFHSMRQADLVRCMQILHDEFKSRERWYDVE